MRFVILADHKDYFHRHRWVEFESLLSESEITTLLEGLDETLQRRVRNQDHAKHRCCGWNSFLFGRDLWREHRQVKKVVFLSRLAEIAAELFQERTLRIAYDQYLIGEQYQLSQYPDLPQWPNEEMTLSKISSIQGIVGGVLIRLTSSSAQHEGLHLVPSLTGSGIFFAADAPFRLSQLLNSASDKFILIVYAQARAIYTLNSIDPHVHLLKKYGYVFGDRLRSALHPIVIRP